MMRVAAALLVWLLCAVAARAEKLPVMSDDAARNLGLKAGEYTTEEARTEGGKAPAGEETGTTAPVVRPNGMTDTQYRLISGADLNTSGRDRRQPATRGPRRETGPGGVPSAPADRQRTTANTQATAPPAPAGNDNSPAPAGGADTTGTASAESAPPKSAQAPRVDRGSTSRIESKLQGMKSAIGGLNADAGPLGGPSGTAPTPPPRPSEPSAHQAQPEPQAQAQTQPQALVKRPDFFSVIPRSRYESLKGAFAASGGARPEFRDMGVNGRDFSWTRSCDQVSGGCNPLALEKSYKKNDEVAPETLANVWKKLKESSASGADDGWADYVKEQRKTYEESLEREAKAESIRAKLSRSIFGAGSRLGGMIRTLVNAARGGVFDSRDAFESGGAAGFTGDGAAVAGATGRSLPVSRSAAAVGREEELLLPPESSAPPWGRIAFALLGAGVFALGVRFLLKRRDEDARVRLAPLIKGRDEGKP